MKKLLTLLAFLACLTMSAQTVITFDASVDKGTIGSSDPEGPDQVSKDGVTVDISKGRMNLVDQYRCFKGATMTITSTVGAITNIEITCTASGTAQYGPGCFTAADGTYTYEDKIGTWTGSAESVVFTAETNQVRMNKIVVTVSGSATPTCATPTFSMPAGTYYNPFTVEVKCGTSGASIFYTTDGTTPTTQSNVYTQPLTISQTTTLKAVATKDNIISDVAEVVYTFASATDVANIAAYQQIADSTQVRFGNPVNVLAQNGNNTFVMDDSGYALIYGKTGQTYKNGDVIPAGFTGTKITYNGEPELSVYATDNFQPASGNSPIEAEEIQAADIAEDLFGHYVLIKGATISVSNNTITDNSGTAPIYTGMGGYGSSTDTTKVYDVYAIVGSYRTKTMTETVYRFLPVKLVVSGETPEPDGITIAEYQQLADNTTATFKNHAVVLAQYGSRLFVKDDTGYMLIYGNVGKTYQRGNVIPAGFSGKKTTYDGEPELASPFSGFQDASSTVLVVAEEANANTLSHANFGHFVVIKNATISSSTITDENGNTYSYYHNMGCSNPADLTKKYDVYGIVGSHGATNTVYQILPTEITLAGGGEIGVPEVEDINALFALNSGTNARIKSDIVAIYQNGNNLYVKNGDTYSLVYGRLTNTFTNGDIIRDAVANWTEYQGAKQLIPVDSTFTVAEHGTAVEPIETPLEEMGQDLVHTYFIVKNASLVNDSTNYYTINDGTMDMLVFNKFNIEMPTQLEGKTFDVKCFLTVYKQQLELYPVEVIGDEIPGVYGDVDGNGIVDTADLAIVIDAILGLSDNTAADVDGNGIIDTTDMALVIDIILGQNE